MDLFHRLIFALLLTTSAFAQFAPPLSQQTTTQANQVPLSGRTGEAGSVTATQAPVAGTTNSVNTINPSIQTAGPYAGSALSTSKPFSGKLSLRRKPPRAAWNITSARSA